MGTDLRAFFNHGDHQLLFELLQMNGAGKTGRPCSDDDQVIVHDFTLSRCVTHLDFCYSRVFD